MTLPTLDEICDDLGIIDFTKLKIKANKEWRISNYLWNGADAKRAFEYSYILREYLALQEARKASQMASREVLGQERFSYDGRDD